MIVGNYKHYLLLKDMQMYFDNVNMNLFKEEDEPCMFVGKKYLEIEQYLVDGKYNGLKVYFI